MEPNQPSTSEEEKQAIILQITQQIIECDNKIMEYFGDYFMQYDWIKKKEILMSDLEDLKNESDLI